MEDQGLLSASARGDLTEVTALLKAGANVNAKAVEGLTALMVASNSGHAAIVKLLLANGSDVNAATTPRGYTPLMFATENGNLEVMRALINAGANVNHQDTDGYTALMDACVHGNVPVIELLLTKADISLQNKKGEIAEHIALEYFPLNPQWIDMVRVAPAEPSGRPPAFGGRHRGRSRRRRNRRRRHTRR